MIEPEILRAGLTQAQQCYDELEQALLPIREAMTDLEQDWEPRGEAFWQRVTTALAPLRQATNACLALYRQEPSTLPMAVSALFETVSIEQSCVLFYLRSRMEEVGLRLTSYQHRSSFAEKHLRQRQWVLQAVRDVDEAGREALQKGRAWFEQVVESQHPPSLLSASLSEATRGKRQRSANKRKAKTRPGLRLVGKPEQQEGPSDPFPLDDGTPS